MQLTARILVPVCALALLSACDKPKSEAKPTEAKAEAKADAKADAKKDDTKAEAHGNPHAGMNPHGNNPHAEPKAGPPRDITPSGETVEFALQEFTLPLPKEWEKGTPSSRMRLAQYALPGPGGDAEMVAYRFPGGAGGVEANVKRWKSQFKPPEGKTVDDVSNTKTFKVGESLEVTLVDVSGRYVAAMMPGQAGKGQHDEADYRMLAAIIQGSGDAVFLKTVGPQKTLDVWAEAYEAMLKEVKVSG